MTRLYRIIALVLTFHVGILTGDVVAQIGLPPAPPTASWSMCTSGGACVTCVANTTSTPKSAGCTLSNGCGFSWIEDSGWTAGCS